VRGTVLLKDEATLKQFVCQKINNIVVNYVAVTSTALVQQINFYHEIITGYKYQKETVNLENGAFIFATL